MKSRGVYETPGGTILMEAHQQLEELVLDRATMETKKTMLISWPRLFMRASGLHLCARLSRHLLSPPRNM